MPALRVLFIGGTGLISSACVERAVRAGFEVSVLNRGLTTIRPLPAGVEMLHADVRDADSVRSALSSREFDSVVDFLAYTAEHVRTSIDLFRGRTAQYVFISSAAAYQMPPPRLPIVESTPLRSPDRQYSLDKIACEDTLVRAYREERFPITIVRPAHTYDRTYVVLAPMGGWTVIDRMRRGRPVVVHGDGTSVYVLTHATDFARGFVGLLGNPQAIGECFHITSDEALTWNQIYEIYAAAAGARTELVHISSETIAALEPDLGPELLDYTAHSMIYDNSKIKALVPDYRATVPFSAGAREIVDWYDSHPERRVVDDRINAILDRLTATRGSGINR